MNKKHYSCGMCKDAMIDEQNCRICAVARIANYIDLKTISERWNRRIKSK